MYRGYAIENGRVVDYEDFEDPEEAGQVAFWLSTSWPEAGITIGDADLFGWARLQREGLI